MSDIFGMPFMPTIGKEAFLRGPTYSIKTDFDALVWRKKGMFSRYHPCYPWVSGLTRAGGFMIQALSVTQWKQIGIGSSAGTLLWI
jgi:hypothetical protein